MALMTVFLISTTLIFSPPSGSTDTGLTKMEKMTMSIKRSFATQEECFAHLQQRVTERQDATGYRFRKDLAAGDVLCTQTVDSRLITAEEDAAYSNAMINLTRQQMSKSAGLDAIK